MYHVVRAIWIIAVVVVSLSILWFLLGTTAFFNRGIDLPTTAMYIFAWAPALILVVLSVIFLIKGWSPRIPEGFIALIIVLSSIFTFSLVATVNIRGWLVESVRRDWAQVTSDERYEYRIELINWFQRNSRVHLYVVNLSTGEELTIPMNVSISEFEARGGEGSIYPVPEDVSSYVMSSLTPTEAENIYILTTLAAMGETGRFEIDIESGTAIEILKKEHYRTSFTRVNNESGQFHYSYSLQLIDTYQNDQRTNVEVLLDLTIGNPPRTYLITLLVDQELLSNDSLRHPREGGTSILPPLWITMEPTDTPGQFIVRTTEELSAEVFLSFLVDIETETAQRIE